MELDLIVFGGTRIIKGKYWFTPKDEVCKFSSGLLPSAEDQLLQLGPSTMSKLVRLVTSVIME